MDRKYISWNIGRNLGGRDGDKLKSIFGLVTWATVADRDIIMLPTRYVSGTYVHGDLSHMGVVYDYPQDIQSMEQIHIKGDTRQHPWEGVSYESFVKYREEFASKKDVHVVTLRGLPRVMPHLMYEWALTRGQPGLMSLYDNTKNWYRDIISSSFATNQVENTIQDKDTYTIAIHIRTGDIAGRMIKNGFDWNYYEMLIIAIKRACFNSNLKPDIQVHSVGNHPMVKWLCNKYQLKNMSSKHVSSTAAFKTFLDCDLFIPASSSLSTVACTIKEHGHIMLPHSGLGLKHYFTSESKYIPQGHIPVNSLTDMVNSLERIFDKQ